MGLCPRRPGLHLTRVRVTGRLHPGPRRGRQVAPRVARRHRDPRLCARLAECGRALEPARAPHCGVVGPARACGGQLGQVDRHPLRFVSGILVGGPMWEQMSQVTCGDHVKWITDEKSRKDRSVSKGETRSIEKDSDLKRRVRIGDSRHRCKEKQQRSKGLESRCWRNTM